MFGTCYYGEHEDLLLSWGIDGRLCVWDSYIRGNIRSPIAILEQSTDYPIYAVDVSKDYRQLSLAGGDGENFIGNPFYLYDTK